MSTKTASTKTKINSINSIRERLLHCVVSVNMVICTDFSLISSPSAVATVVDRLDLPKVT